MNFASNFFPSPSTNFLLKKKIVFSFLEKYALKKHHPEKNILISPKNIMLLPPVISPPKKKKKGSCQEIQKVDMRKKCTSGLNPHYVGSI